MSARDRLDILGELGAYTIIPAASLAAIMTVEDVPEDPPAPEPDKPGEREALYLDMRDLSKETTQDCVLPAAFRADWAYVSTEPAPTDGTITLTILEFYQGEWMTDEGVGRRRLAVYARRQEKRKTWDLHVGFGVVREKEDGTTYTDWEERSSIKGLPFGDILQGSLTVHDELLLKLEEGSRRAFSAPWTFDGPVVVQVGHEDGKPGGEGKGDEPFRDGHGVVQIFDVYQGGKPASEVHPSAAVYGFAAWLTGRPLPVVLGAKCEAAAAAELVQRFIDSQGWGHPPDHWEKSLAPYPNEPALAGDDDATVDVGELVDGMLNGKPSKAVSGDQGAGFMWVWKHFDLDDLDRAGEWSFKLGDVIDYRKLREDPIGFMIGTAVQLIERKSPAGKLAYLLAIRRWQGTAPTFTVTEAREAAGMPAEPDDLMLSSDARGLAHNIAAEIDAATTNQLPKLRRIAGDCHRLAKMLGEVIAATKRSGVDR